MVKFAIRGRRFLEKFEINRDGRYDDVFYWAKIFAEFFCRLTPNGPKREKKTVGEKSPTSDRI